MILKNRNSQLAYADDDDDGYLKVRELRINLMNSEVHAYNQRAYSCILNLYCEDPGE